MKKFLKAINTNKMPHHVYIIRAQKTFYITEQEIPSSNSMPLLDYFNWLEEVSNLRLLADPSQIFNVKNADIVYNIDLMELIKSTNSNFNLKSISLKDITQLLHNYSPVEDLSLAYFFRKVTGSYFKDMEERLRCNH